MGNPFKCRLWYFGKAQPDVVEITSESLEETREIIGVFCSGETSENQVSICSPFILIAVLEKQ